MWEEFRLKRQIEGTVIIFFTLLFATLLFTHYKTLYFLQRTDGAGFVDLIRAVSDGHGMVSPVFSSFYSVFPLLTAPAEIFCNSPLSSLYQDSSFSIWHPYLWVYPLGIFSHLSGITPLDTAAGINAINIVGGCALLYWFLRHNSIHILIACFFILAVVSFQPLLGHITGQFYYDRLCFLPGLVLVLSLSGNIIDGRRRYLLVGGAFFCCASLSERVAIVSTVLILIQFMTQDRLRFCKQNIPLLFLGILGMVYLIVYMKIFQESPFYNGILVRNIQYTLSNSITPGNPLFWKTLQWGVVIGPFLLVCLFRPVLSLWVFSALLPNFVITVGGAERTGFLTHYHALYLPVLVGAAAICIKELSTCHENWDNKSQNTSWFQFSLKSRGNIMIFLLLIVIYNIYIGVGSNRSIVEIRKGDEIVQAYAWLRPGSDYNAFLRKRRVFLQSFVRNIPSDASVSAPETMMPSLVVNGNRSIDYMPIGIGDVAYMIVEYNSQTHNMTIPSYLDDKENKAISECLQVKLDQYYIKVKTETNWGMTYVLYLLKAIHEDRQHHAEKG